MRLIDADAFIEYIKETSEKLEFDKFHVDSALTAKIILDGVIADLDGTSRDGFKNAPTIEPEEKKGKWLDPDVFDNADYPIEQWQSMKCSQCGKYYTTPYAYNLNNDAYCPYCGSHNRK